MGIGFLKPLAVVLLYQPWAQCRVITTSLFLQHAEVAPTTGPLHTLFLLSIYLLGSLPYFLSLYSRPSLMKHPWLVSCPPLLLLVFIPRFTRDLLSVLGAQPSAAPGVYISQSQSLSNQLSPPDTSFIPHPLTSTAAKGKESIKQERGTSNSPFYSTPIL